MTVEVVQENARVQGVSASLLKILYENGRKAGQKKTAKVVSTLTGEEI